MSKTVHVPLLTVAASKLWRKAHLKRSRPARSMPPRIDFSNSVTCSVGHGGIAAANLITRTRRIMWRIIIYIILYYIILLLLIPTVYGHVPGAWCPPEEHPFVACDDRSIHHRDVESIRSGLRHLIVNLMSSIIVFYIISTFIGHSTDL